MSTTSNTPADLYTHLKFITGMDNLSAVNATNMLKYAIDDYSSIAMSADGHVKFDDRNYTTYPIATGTVSITNPKIELAETFLQIDRVEITVDGETKVLKAIDRREHKNESLVEFYGDSGTPTHYDVDANGIEVFPHPDQDYSVSVYHTRAAKYYDVTDDVTEIGIPRTHHYYLILHCSRQMGFRTIDGNRTDIAQELIKWEGQMVNGRMTGGKIREYYANRDEDRPRRIRSKQSNLSIRTL